MPPNDYTPEVDTSYGLIYRLNYLWARADGEALAGNLEQWELVLDRLISNLLYRNEATIIKDEKGDVISVHISDENMKAWEKLKENIRKAKQAIYYAIRNRKGINHSKECHYQAVMTYDIWLRKFMHNELKLYMKEVESAPGSSLFGRANFGKKRGR